MEKEIGILCHISSLPSVYGVGDFGKEAYKFVDFLSKNNINIWQILPLNQTGETNCPYYSNCCFSYDEMFFDVDDLIEKKLITKRDTLKLLKLPKSKKVVYNIVKKEKETVFEKAYNNISKELLADLSKFLQENEDIYNYAVYKTLLEKNNLFDWRLLNKNLLNRKSKQYNKFVADNKQTILKYGFYQYILNLEWKKLKNYANSKGIKILGDLPIYPNVMSFDVYDSKDKYQLDDKYNMICTGGVPKSETDDYEQNWGSCVYDWKILEKTNYQYIIKKIKMLLEKFDILRLDHFYGYFEHYEFSTTNNADNKWVRAGGMDFFTNLSKQIDINKIVVENLGFEKTECDQIMKKFNLTGMCLLQEAVRNERYTPNNVKYNNIYYIGTHDNNTFLGYLENLDSTSKKHLCEILNSKEINNNKKILISAMKQMLRSEAKYDVFQIQDLLMQGSFYRMNIPGVAFDQWEYKMPKRYKNKAKCTLKHIRN